MNSKPLIGALLIFPIVVIGYSIIFAPQPTRETAKPTTKVSETNDMSGFSESVSPGGEDRRNDSFQKSIRSHEEERTQIRYDLAERASKRDTENYPSQREFLLSKHQSTFDAWSLSPRERDHVVGSVDNYTKELGIAFRDSARSWPVQVGHAANRDANKKHDQALQQSIKDLKAKLYLELKTSVGTKFADDFMAKNFPPLIKQKPNQFLPTNVKTWY